MRPTQQAVCCIYHALSYCPFKVDPILHPCHPHARIFPQRNFNICSHMFYRMAVTDKEEVLPHNFSLRGLETFFFNTKAGTILLHHSCKLVVKRQRRRRSRRLYTSYDMVIIRRCYKYFTAHYRSLVYMWLQDNSLAPTAAARIQNCEARNVFSYRSANECMVRYSAGRTEARFTAPKN